MESVFVWVLSDEHLNIEPYVGMEFAPEEAAEVFYDAYATSLLSIMWVDAFWQSLWWEGGLV